MQAKGLYQSGDVTSPSDLSDRSDYSKEVIQGADFGTENPADYFGDLEEVSPLLYPDTERLDDVKNSPMKVFPQSYNHQEVVRSPIKP
jgi:hypothetical protein